MAFLKILHYPDPILQQPAVPVKHVDRAVRQLAMDMAETMYAAPGVGLAAPQVGHSIRLAVIDITPRQEGKNLLILVNPEIVQAEGECMWEEGCLSVPDCSEEVKRKKRVTVHYQNLEGETLELNAEDLLAVVLQHEIDHLDGILFVDRLSRLKRNLLKKKLRKMTVERHPS